MNPWHWVKLYELRKLLDVQSKIIAQGGTAPTWLSSKIAELEAEV